MSFHSSRRTVPRARLSDRVETLFRVALPRSGLKAMRDFTAELLRSPRSIGAICPSGPQLANRMAGLIPAGGSGLIVEIGAGTGSVTQAILQHGIAPERLIVIERSASFCRILRHKFPNLRIVQGDAARLVSLLPNDQPVDAVVSSLPLMSLPEQVRSDIIYQIRQLLGSSGCVIQFTYALWATSPFRQVGYTCDQKSLVIRNVPPARLERFRPASLRTCLHPGKQTEVSRKSWKAKEPN